MQNKKTRKDKKKQSIKLNENKSQLNFMMLVVMQSK